jgi:hypothetical protein
MIDRDCSARGLIALARAAVPPAVFFAQEALRRRGGLSKRLARTPTGEDPAFQPLLLAPCNMNERPLAGDCGPVLTVCKWVFLDLRAFLA